MLPCLTALLATFYGLNLFRLIYLKTHQSILITIEKYKSRCVVGENYLLLPIGQGNAFPKVVPIGQKYPVGQGVGFITGPYAGLQ